MIQNSIFKIQYSKFKIDVGLAFLLGDYKFQCLVAQLRNGIDEIHT